MSTTPDDLINHKIGNGQYEIRSLLGKGGMATVYLARQASMNRNVAIKVMSPELADDEQFVTRFEHEAQLIAKLQHPHILPVIDFGREGKHIYIVVQLVQGGSLDDRLTEGPLPLKMAGRMFEQIASALSFAHSQGVIHRDLKPNNVLLDERSNAYLTDFGIAKMLAGTQKLTATGNILGTPAYMAPEQWRGEPVDARTDIYSLGIMLYEMVLGRLPFAGDTPFTLMYKHFNDPPPAPRMIKPDLNPAVEAVILKALAKDADDRYQSAEEMAEELTTAVRAATVTPPTGARPAPPMERTVIGEGSPTLTETPPAGQSIEQMPTLLPTAPGMKVTPGTGAGVPGAVPTRAAPALESAPKATAQAPAKRGMNPLVIGGAVVGVIAVIVVVALLALGGGGEDKKVAVLPTSTDTPEPTATLTLTPEPTNTPTPEPTSTNTLTPTDTPQPTDTATPTYTATPRTTSATVLTERANVRRGPGTDYEVIGSLARDEEVIVVGISEDGQWYRVVSSSLTDAGWVSAEIVRISGNTNIPVVHLPTATPTSTPSATLTETPTNTPEPSITPTPTEEPVDPALFQPPDYKNLSSSEFNLSFDYPANWETPRYFDSLGYISLQAEDDLNTSRSPWIRIARGTPQRMVEINLTRDSSDPIKAVENTVGTSSFTHTEETGFIYPAYKVEYDLTQTYTWAWVIVIGPEDWLYIVAISPTGEYKQPFETNVLPKILNSITVDGVALAGSPASATPVPGLDSTLYLPTEFKTITLSSANVTMDYPANWPDPQTMGLVNFLSAMSGADSSNYPSVAIARGTPDDLVTAGMTNDSSDPVKAVEHPFGTDFSGQSIPETRLDFLAYRVNMREAGTHAWAMLVVLGPSDWLMIVATAPMNDYDQDFGERILSRMFRSIQVDGKPLAAAGAENTTVLDQLPIQLGTPVLDRFDDNTNDWRFANIIDGELQVEAPELDFVRWSFPFTLLEGDAAYYAQVTGRITNDTNFYQYGMAFRVVDASNFYYYEIDYQQQFTLYKDVKDNYEIITGPTYDSSIQIGPNQSNTFGVLALGDYLELYLNGHRVWAGVDSTHATGGARVAIYSYTDANTPVTAVFDDYAYLPLILTGDQTLVDQRQAVIATSSAPLQVLSLPSDTQGLVPLEANQPFAVLARSANGQFFYGYGQGATGWIPAQGVQLQRGGVSTEASVLPILPTTAQGVVVHTWPVVWPEESTTATPAPETTLAYGQTVEGTIEEFGMSSWTFAGNAGDVITLAAEATDNANLDLSLSLNDASGSAVAFDDDSGRGRNPLIERFTLPSSDVFTVEVSSLANGGAFTLTLKKN